MIQAFIKIRYKQFYRGIRGLGLTRIVFLTGLFGFAAFSMFVYTSQVPNVYLTSSVYLLIIAIIHLNRQDKLFLKSHFINYKLVYLIEYILLSIPILVSLIYHKQLIAFTIVLLAIGLIVNLNIKPIKSNLNTKFQQLIPNDSFEWKAGIRKILFLIMPLWIIGFFTSFYIGSVPIVIFILGIIPLSFYEKCEPIQMILSFEMNTQKFLFHKIKLQTVLFSVITIPLLIVFIIFHTEIWYIPIAEYLLFISLHVYIILTKYSFYEPNKKPGGSQIFGAIGATGTIIPVFIPVVWLLSIRFYYKASKKLNFYLNDYN